MNSKFFYLFSNVMPELIYSGFQLLVRKLLVFLVGPRSGKAKTIGTFKPTLTAGPSFVQARYTDGLHAIKKQTWSI